MKSLFVILALTVVGFSAHAFEDQIECRVSSCNPSGPVNPGDCRITKWHFRLRNAGRDVVIGFTTVGGAESQFYTRGTSSVAGENLYISMEDDHMGLDARIPLTCQKGQFNESCYVESGIDGRVVLSYKHGDATAAHIATAKYRTRCFAVN